MCPYSINISKGIYYALTCSITNDFCGMCRFCHITKELVMSDIYNQKGCVIKNNYEKNQKDGDDYGDD